MGRSGTETVRDEGDRFDFAGGQCLAIDVDIIYEGPGNLDFSRAAGYI